MKRPIRAPAVVVVGVLAAMGVIAAPARSNAAAASLSTHDLQVTPLGADNQPNTDSGVTASLDPGASATRSFLVTNRTSGLRVTVRFSAVDATAAGGQVQFAAGASASGAASWLTLSDVVATIEPQAALRVTLTIAPPGNVDPGQVFAGVVARVDHSVRLADGNDGPSSDPITMPVTIDVKGAATALVSIAGVNVVKHGDASNLEVTFQNGGATANTMAGTLTVLGSAPRSFPLRTTVAPLTRTIERVPYDLASGAKTVSVVVDTEDANGNQAAWNGKVGPEPAPSRAAAAAPAASRSRVPANTHAHGGWMPRLLTGLVGVSLALAAAWFGAEVVRARRRRVATAVTREVRVPRVRRTKAIPILNAVSAERADDRKRSAAVPPVADIDAVAAQLGALVGAIDRLVTRLGEVTPGAVGECFVPAPEATARAESGAILYAEAAPAAADRAFDPYDWPTEAQLDEFVARRKSGRGDPR